MENDIRQTEQQDKNTIVVKLTKSFIVNCEEQGISKENIPEFIKITDRHFLPIVKLNNESCSQVKFNLNEKSLEIIDPFNLLNLDCKVYKFQISLQKKIKELLNNSSVRR